MAFILGEDIKRIVDPEAFRAIRNELAFSLAKGAYSEGLSHTLTKLKVLPGPGELEHARKQRGQWMIVAGLVILIAVFYMNLAKRRRATRYTQ
jgi:uncharacterized membrane protein YgcG